VENPASEIRVLEPRHIRRGFGDHEVLRRAAIA
jgi:hypothetical protein